MTHYLGGENYVFWGGREGYQSLLNTDMERELDHMVKWPTVSTCYTSVLVVFRLILSLAQARFFEAAVAYKKKIGFNGNLHSRFDALFC